MVLLSLLLLEKRVQGLFASILLLFYKLVMELEVMTITLAFSGDTSVIRVGGLDALFLLTVEEGYSSMFTLFLLCRFGEIVTGVQCMGVS